MKSYIIKYRDCKIHKDVYTSGRTRLTYSIVTQVFKTEKEADDNLDNFIITALDILSNEGYD